MKLYYALSTALLAELVAATPLPQTTAAADCKTYLMLFARGTTEPGTLGVIVGPGLEKSVEAALGADQVTVQGVDYSADAAGIASEVGGSGPGSVAMAADATTALASCPDTKVILTGYSQGAMVVHNAASKLNTAGTISSVVAAVTFGDPYKTQLPSGIVTADFHTFCASGDEVCLYGTGTCAGTGGCTSASTSGHIGYGADVDTAASFIQSVVSGSTSVATSVVSSAASVATAAAGLDTASSGSGSGFGFGTGLGSLPTGLGSGAGFSIPTALPTLGGGLGSGFSIPAFSIPTALPTGFPGLGSI